MSSLPIAGRLVLHRRGSWCRSGRRTTSGGVGVAAPLLAGGGTVDRERRGGDAHVNHRPGGHQQAAATRRVGPHVRRVPAPFSAFALEPMQNTNPYNSNPVCLHVNCVYC
jgi:hypothetical protein